MGSGVIPGVGRVYIKLSGLNANFPFFGFLEHNNRADNGDKADNGFLHVC